MVCFNTVLSPISGAVCSQISTRFFSSVEPFTSARASAVPLSTCSHFLHHALASEMHFWVRGHYDCHYYRYVRECRISKTTGFAEGKGRFNFTAHWLAVGACVLACKLCRRFASGEDSAKERCVTPLLHTRTCMHTNTHSPWVRLSLLFSRVVIHNLLFLHVGAHAAGLCVSITSSWC